MAKRLTIAEIKRKSSGKFFDRDTMKFWKGDKYGTRFDRTKKVNYVKVKHPASRGGGETEWRFDEKTGKLHPQRTRR